MQVEVWSPDGMEAMHHEPLVEVRVAENTEAILLLGNSGGARVWLNAGDERFLREMLSRLDALRASDRSLVGAQPEEDSVGALRQRAPETREGGNA